MKNNALLGFSGNFVSNFKLPLHNKIAQYYDFLSIWPIKSFTDSCITTDTAQKHAQFELECVLQFPQPVGSHSQVCLFRQSWHHTPPFAVESAFVSPAVLQYYIIEQESNQ